MASGMEILQKPTATVGQIVRDLELIVAKSPDIYLEYWYDDDHATRFVEGIKLRKDIAIFETTVKRYRATTLKDILAMLKTLDASVRVVMQVEWELLDFRTNEDGSGSILWYDDEENYCLYRLGRNVQLITTQQMEAELKEKCGKDDFSRKVALVMKEPRWACLMNSLQWHYDKLCLCYSKDEEKESITVAELLEAFPPCAEFMVCLYGKYHTVEVGEKGIFFGHKKGEERYLCFNLGKEVYDPEEEWEI